MENENARPKGKLEISEVIENKRTRKIYELFDGDAKNLALLYFLYLLQGIPLGLCSSLPLLLQNRGVSYRQQAQFSLVQWPFSVKLIWAPLVDFFYWKKFGRRKTWLIPTQWTIGIAMFIMSFFVSDWMGENGNEINITMLTATFFLLYFLAATQDIAVDGWALTMLNKKNIGHASTCNSTGQTTGSFIGYVIFMALESAEFSNKYLRSTPKDKGIITLPEFLVISSVVFISTTTLVAIFKKEKEREEENQDNSETDEIESQNIKEAYFTLWRIIKLPAVQFLALVLFTAKIGYGPTESAENLKLIDAGYPHEKLGLITVPLVPLQLLLVFYLSRWSAGPKPLSMYLSANALRVMFNFVSVGLVLLAQNVIVNGIVPSYFSWILLAVFGIKEILGNVVMMTSIAFFAKVSDPKVGGTYMTLLNTLANLGGMWVKTLSLWLLDILTWNENCFKENFALNSTNVLYLNNSSIQKLSNNTCSNSNEKNICKDFGGKCQTKVDGFYLETGISLFLGIIWLILMKNRILRLQTLDKSHWRIRLNMKNESK